MIPDVPLTSVCGVGVYVHMCAHMNVEAKRQPQCHSSGTVYVFCFLKLPEQPWLSGQKAPRTCLSLPVQCWNCKHAWSCLAFPGGFWGFNLGSHTCKASQLPSLPLSLGVRILCHSSCSLCQGFCSTIGLFQGAHFFIPPLPREVGEAPVAKCITLVLSPPALFQALTILDTNSSLQ